MFVAVILLAVFFLFGFSGDGLSLPADIKLLGPFTLSGVLVGLGRFLKAAVFRSNPIAKKFIPFILIGAGGLTGLVSGITSGYDIYGVLSYTVGGVVIALASVGAHSTGKNAKQGREMQKG